MLLSYEFASQVQDIILNRFGKQKVIPHSFEMHIKDQDLGGFKKKVKEVEGILLAHIFQNI